MYSKIRSELSLEYVKAAQNSFSTRDGQLSYAFKCHIVDESPSHSKLTMAIFCMLLGAYYLSSPENSMVS